LICKIQGA